MFFGYSSADNEEWEKVSMLTEVSISSKVVQIEQLLEEKRHKVVRS